MNIVNIAPSAPYNEGWGYQDNLLPKYQAKLGHHVTLIITNRQHENGRIVSVNECDYISPSGFRVIRRKNKRVKIADYFPIYDLLLELRPDFIFFHGLVSTAILQVVKYKRKINPNLVIVQDNHLDYNIGFRPDTWKGKIASSFYRTIFRCSEKYIDKVYGVTPWRKTYAEDFFKVPASKTDVLIMGADDEKLHLENREQIRNEIRKKYHIADNDFLIVTGGKIDKRKGIEILAEACAELKEKEIKLIIFGNILEDVKGELESLLTNNDNLIYIGWIDSDKAYDYFYAADLVFFPGQHSVLWEQACASKVPCVFKRWKGMEHVNHGGNSDFLSTITVDTVKSKIDSLHFTEQYYHMKEVAESDKTDIYLYSKIAEKSLECARRKKGS